MHPAPLWQGDYAIDPEGNAAAMWGSVGKMVEWDQVYDEELGTLEVKAKLQAARDMLRVNYVFACERMFKMWYTDPVSVVDDDETQDTVTPIVSSVPSIFHSLLDWLG
jgi:hypothetical protein